MATVRLFSAVQQKFYSTYKVTQDYRENSVLSGLGLLGGFWTFLNGIFAITFGCTLLLVLFGTIDSYIFLLTLEFKIPFFGLGIKPLSIYGILGSRQSLANGAALSTEEQAHIVALLREHLMDVGETINRDPEANHPPQSPRNALRCSTDCHTLLSSHDSHDFMGDHDTATPSTSPRHEPFPYTEPVRGGGESV